MTGCCAIGCSNRSEQGFVLKVFPKDPKRRALWALKVRRHNWVPTGKTYICEVHFDDDQWEKPKVGGRLKLKHDAVPTIFSYVPNQRIRTAPMVRNSTKKLKLTYDERLMKYGLIKANNPTVEGRLLATDKFINNNRSCDAVPIILSCVSIQPKIEAPIERDLTNSKLNATKGQILNDGSIADSNLTMAGDNTADKLNNNDKKCAVVPAILSYVPIQPKREAPIDSNLANKKLNATNSQMSNDGLIKGSNPTVDVEGELITPDKFINNDKRCDPVPTIFSYVPIQLKREAPVDSNLINKKLNATNSQMSNDGLIKGYNPTVDVEGELITPDKFINNDKRCDAAPTIVSYVPIQPKIEAHVKTDLTNHMLNATKGQVLNDELIKDNDIKIEGGLTTADKLIRDDKKCDAVPRILSYVPIQPKREAPIESNLTNKKLKTINDRVLNDGLMKNNNIMVERRLHTGHKLFNGYKGCDTDIINEFKQKLASANATINKLSRMNRILQLKLGSKTSLVYYLKKKFRTNKYKGIFNDDQMEAIRRKNMAFTKWSKKTVETALELKSACGSRGYKKLLSLNFPFPSIRTLERRLKNADENIAV